MSTDRRYSISKAESFANRILVEAESKKKKYLDEAHDIAEKEIRTYEQGVKEEYNKKSYDLGKEKKDFDDSKVSELERVKRDFEANNKKAVDFLIDNITTVNVKLQRNIVADFDTLKVTR